MKKLLLPLLFLLVACGQNHDPSTCIDTAFKPLIASNGDTIQWHKGGPHIDKRISKMEKQDSIPPYDTAERMFWFTRREGKGYSHNSIFIPITMTDSGFFLTDHVHPDRDGDCWPDSLPKYIRQGKYMIILCKLPDSLAGRPGFFDMTNEPPKPHKP
jgi:hypothetical protein